MKIKREVCPFSSLFLVWLVELVKNRSQNKAFYVFDIVLPSMFISFADPAVLFQKVLIIRQHCFMELTVFLIKQTFCQKFHVFGCQ